MLDATATQLASARWHHPHSDPSVLSTAGQVCIVTGNNSLSVQRFRENLIKMVVARISRHWIGWLSVRFISVLTSPAPVTAPRQAKLVSGISLAIPSAPFGHCSPLQYSGPCLTSNFLSLIWLQEVPPSLQDLFQFFCLASEITLGYPWSVLAKKLKWLNQVSTTTFYLKEIWKREEAVYWTTKKQTDKSRMWCLLQDNC